MNTERTPYSAEDNESDDSAAVSFGSGPAFRPIPRIERPKAPEPQPESPPRIPEGLLFSRSQEKKDDDDSDEDDAAARPQSVASAASATQAKPATAPKQPQPAEALNLMAPAPEVSTENGALQQHETQADKHLPDLGEFTAILPETPPVPDVSPQQPTAERTQTEHPSLPPAENERLTRTYPAETAADLPEWPEASPDSSDPPLSPVPPRQSPAVGQFGQFEAPPSSVIDADKATYATAATTLAMGAGGGARGGGGGWPSPSPSGAGGGMPPGNQPPNTHNAYFGTSGYNPNYGGGAGGGYSPNAMPAPNAQPHYEVVQPVAQKKGNIWPYVAVLGENIARKRADRKLKKELSSRIDQQERAQEVSGANQLRLERQQQELLNGQQRQAIRETHRPSGNEWGVPQQRPAGAMGAPGQRVPGERAMGVMGQAEQAAPAPNPEQQMEQPAEVNQPTVHERHSAWHTYYEENGHQVAGVEYGKGFKQEQKEIVRDHSGDSVAAGVAGIAGGASAARGNGGAGGSHRSAGQAGTSYSGGYGGGQGPQGYQPQSYQQPALPSGMTTPSLSQGAPTHTDPQHQLPEHTKQSNVPGPLFWLMITLIIVAFFAAALI